MGGARLLTAVCMVCSFLVGGIPFGLILGRAKGNVDIRTAGSGNIGTTNALRVAGPQVAAGTLLLDCLKGVACVCASRWAIAQALGGDAGRLAPGGSADYLLGLVALACVCGHLFSPYLHFKGGKGIAAGLGVLLGWYWPIGVSLLGLFAVGVALTRHVSVGSLAAAVGLPVATAAVFPAASLALKLIMLAFGALVVWAHRGNIRKLARGSESDLSFTRRDRPGDGVGAGDGPTAPGVGR